MKQLTLEERRRVFLTRQRASQAMLEPFPYARVPSHAPEGDVTRAVRLLMKGLMIAVLLGVGLLVVHTVTFRLPTSLLDALLPHL